ncbi:hypothetical protein BD410DRAFT_310061 [Rickenella mellea]|uniref:Uncharacterized protein n=1 Tax=Rickenella mellea TaxID=50990 RepID=A0A4Y7Q391_9AGAM|nr:hypothetical protein BD410DRAFT_310061 [Rickenella mellea]
MKHITDHIQSFTFLSQKDVLLTMSPKATPYACMLVVVDLDKQASPNRCSVTTTLLLPELLPDSKVMDVVVHSGPRMGSFAASDRVPFRTARENRLVTITLQFHLGYPLVFCVPQSTINNFMNSKSREVSKLSECMEQGIPWENWGPQGSSMITDVAILDGCYTWGSRCIFESTRQASRTVSEKDLLLSATSTSFHSNGG